jgi:hypothetical protein
MSQQTLHFTLQEHVPGASPLKELYALVRRQHACAVE